MDGIYNVIYTIASEITRGDRVLASTSASEQVKELAVKRADGSIVLFLLNLSDEEREINLRMSGKIAIFTLPANSLSANRIC